MRFKNRYYLIELIWEAQQPINQPAAASAGTAAIAASASAATPAVAHYAASPAAASATAGLHNRLPSLSLRTVDPSLQAYTLQTAVRDALRDSFGDLTAGRCMQSLTVRYLNSLTNVAIIRVARSDHRALAASLCFVTAIKSKPATLRTVHIGGTIRSCQKAALRLQKKRMDELRAQLAAAEAALTTTTGGSDAASPDATSASSSSASASSDALLRDALSGATARTNQTAVVRTAQQTLRQMANLLSNFRGAQAAAAALAQQHHAAGASAAAAATASLAAQLSRGEQSVPPTVAAISDAIAQAESKAEQEVSAMEV